MPARTKSEEMLDATVKWYMRLDYARVRDGGFTATMKVDAYGVYFWGAERGHEIRHLYIGQATDIVARQEAHFRGTLGVNLRRIREQRWEPFFYCGHIYSPEYCGNISDRNAIRVMSLVEKSLIYQVKPEWNRQNSGHMTLERHVRVVNAGTIPPDFRKTINLREGLHA